MMYRQHKILGQIPKRLLASLLFCGLVGCGQMESQAAPAAAAEPAPVASAPAPTSAPAPAAEAAVPEAAETPSLPEGGPVEVTPELVEAGRKIYFSAGCNACHGGTGGGGMCPPLTNDIWIYGDSDDVLRVIISEGTAGMVKYGLPRIGQERVVGQMPPFDAVLQEGDVDKLVAFIRSVHADKGESAK
ncbi:c-type cytochrome [Coralloluteibacterium thermophilus]|uniref:C-type cytochrome n=1 Tax=Coralloluteibacterium thermophilum TaxID=2707049 RepID=A0ABV9NF24_9GAMM